MEEYRFIRVSYPIGNPSDDFNPPQYIERYEVQVKGFLWWHTIKSFKKIRPAYMLLTTLKQEENEA